MLGIHTPAEARRRLPTPVLLSGRIAKWKPGVAGSQLLHLRRVGHIVLDIADL